MRSPSKQQYSLRQTPRRSQDKWLSGDFLDLPSSSLLSRDNSIKQPVAPPGNFNKRLNFNSSAPKDTTLEVEMHHLPVPNYLFKEPSVNNNISMISPMAQQKYNGMMRKQPSSSGQSFAKHLGNLVSPGGIKPFMQPDQTPNSKNMQKQISTATNSMQSEEEPTMISPILFQKQRSMRRQH